MILWKQQNTIIARVMQSPLVMQNGFPSPQNMLHCLFLLELRYILLLSYKAIFSTKRNHPWEPIEIHKGCKTVNFTVNVLSMYFCSSKKIETLHPSLWYLFICKPHHLSLIFAD